MSGNLSQSPSIPATYSGFCFQHNTGFFCLFIFSFFWCIISIEFMKAFRFSKEFILLSFLFFFALFLRTYNLSSIPPGLHGDEASIGYNAYSLLKTAKDQNGNFLPIAIDQFGDFRPAGYHYLDVPFVAVLGLNAWAVRLPAAIFGALCVLVFFYLLRELFENKVIPWIGAVFLTISPWHLIISRASSESVIAAFFVLLHIRKYRT